MATLYIAVIDKFNQKLIAYVREKYNYRALNILSNIDMADVFYIFWESKGGKELQLPGFKMTNRQMLWLSIAHVFTSKYHQKVITTKSKLNQLQIEYLHTYFKNIKGFREAFGCSGLTDEEKQQAVEFGMKVKMVRESEHSSVSDEDS